MHRPAPRSAALAAWRLVASTGSAPGINRLLTHGVRVAFRPSYGANLSARDEPAARDLARHAFADVPGNVNLARSWARFARHWPAGPRRELLDLYRSIDMPVLLLWADEDRLHPLLGAEEALDLLPDAQLRVLSRAGYLIAYDDPVGVVRELIAFCG
jgi:pimeloyl-ACP methyl ester carboxylesterase